jgi:iron(III) transport system substrate-binding protein
MTSRRGRGAPRRGGGARRGGPAAPNPGNAVAFLEFLASDAAQWAFADGNHEFPSVPNIELPPALAAWKDFKADPLRASVLGEHNAEAMRIADRVGWR